VCLQQQEGYDRHLLLPIYGLTDIWTGAEQLLGLDTGAHNLSNVAAGLAAIVVSSVNKLDTIRRFGESQLLPVGELAGSLKNSGVERDSLNSEPELLLVAVR